MTILLTGASGFVGQPIYQALYDEHTITTLGRTAVGTHHINCDLAWEVPSLRYQAFELIIHAAGKAHSQPRGRSERKTYEQVNVQGVSRLLTALEQTRKLPSVFVYLSTVLVYGLTSGQAILENAPLRATDTYGKSKRDAELILRNWATKHGIRLTILRLPLVVGAGQKGNLAAMQQAIRRGFYLGFGDGQSRRSMVRADDVANVLVRAARVGGTFILTDGHHPTVRALEEAMAKRSERRWPIPRLPIWLAKSVARLGDGITWLTGKRLLFDSNTLQKLTQSLTFSDDLAQRELNWQPRPVLDLLR